MVIEILTFSSLLREFVTASKRLSIALVESDLDKPAEEATEAIKSFLFTLDSFYYVDSLILFSIVVSQR
mgnify:FL=1